jgi:hypothetical protein
MPAGTEPTPQVPVSSTRKSSDERKELLGRTVAAQITTVRDAYPVGSPAPTSRPPGDAEHPRWAIAHQLRYLWARCNTEGISLAQAVTAGGSSRPASMGGVDFPTE